MPDVTVKLSDGIREITVEINGSTDDPLPRAEETAVRLYIVATTENPTTHRTGFTGRTLTSDTERNPEKA